MVSLGESGKELRCRFWNSGFLLYTGTQTRGLQRGQILVEWESSGLCFSIS